MSENTYDYHLVVLGEPRAQKRMKYATRGRDGKALPFIRNYDPSAGDKQTLHQIVQQHAPPKPLLGPLRVDLFLYFGYRKQDYGSGRNAGILKPNAPQWKDTGKDRDNCDKLILDALTGVFFVNDSQVCAGEIIKKYAERPRTEIGIRKLNEPGGTK